ncbi:MAG: DUF2085 domain-containing protein [Acidobacteria bacterium]|nr:DUF2085 domain-containing protein [Acidobacteriota bacterium]
MLTAIAVLAAAWAGLLVSAPLLPVPAAGVLYLFGSVICHQLADRSFHLDGAQLPVCARCLGIYAGFAVGAVLSAGPLACATALARGTRPTYERLRRPGAAGRMIGAPRTRRLLIAAAVPTALTVALEAAGLWHTSNLVRFVAGAPLGLALALVVVGASTGGASARR